MKTLKTLLFIGIFSIGLNGFATEVDNGLSMNGLTFNGIHYNGLTFNGIRLNGLTFNGMESKLTSINFSKLANKPLVK